ncbi:transcriptional regulator [Roseibium algae]|uniref:Transcriptional regulator n=1 Tax=Roseibium algae TaxID=3123038 RepID=A0ABU8TLG4_9HYPH
MRAIFVGLLAGLALVFSFGPSSAAELLMLEQPGCVWCKRWNEEIGVIYSKTEEGRQAPLRRVDITEAWPSDLENVRRERMTPTFILIDEGQEVARLRGYPGDNFFWPMLSDMLFKLPQVVN